MITAEDSVAGFPLVSVEIGLSGSTAYFLPSLTGAQSMGCVICGADGRVFVIDGGWRDDAFLIEELVRRLLPDLPTVTLWLISHGHMDHIGAISEIMRRGRLAVQAVCHALYPPELWEKFDTRTDKDMAAYTALYHSFPSQDVEAILPRVGDIFKFGTLAFEVMRTPDPSVTANFGNNSSVVYRMTAAGKSILFLGDLGEECGDVFMRAAGDRLKCDAVVMAHHGQGGVKESFYRVVSPKAAIWPAPGWLWNNERSGLCIMETRKWMSALGVENYVTKDGILAVR